MRLCLFFLLLAVLVESTAQPKNVSNIRPHSEGYAESPRPVPKTPTEAYPLPPHAVPKKAPKAETYAKSPHSALKKAPRVQNQGPRCGTNERATFCNDCDGTCDDPTERCPFFCQFGTGPNCECRRGFVRDNGRCIRPSECSQTCPFNEEFRQCATACEPTCDNRNPTCTSQCQSPRCQCIIGVLRYNGQCVPPSSCPPSPQQCTGANEVFRQCATACEPTCQIQQPSCTTQCVSPRCQCDTGFVRNNNGRCIRPQFCPAQPPTCTVANEIFRQCATACEPTCQNQQPICSLQCLSPRCQCDTGFVRNNGQCIRPQFCPAQPPTCTVANEVFRQCASACEPTCQNRQPICTLQCVSPRCQCDTGFVRNKGQCIRPQFCPAQPPRCTVANEVFRQCASACEPTCQNQQPTCTMQCLSPRCQCDTGFVRSNGQCIRPQTCPSQPQTCPPNQVWNQCSTVCEPSCRDFNPVCMSVACGPPKCQCRPNFYRQSTFPNAPCVPWWQCRRRPGFPGVSPRPWNWWGPGRPRG